MPEVAEFIKGWIPSIGVLIAGLWALYSWIRSEKLRETKERTSLEGNLKYSQVQISEETYLAIFTATWKNLSPLPVSVDTKKTFLDIYRIDPDLQLGGIDLKINPEALGSPIVELTPYAKLRSFILEPNAQADLQTMAALKKGSVYLVRFKLYRKTAKGAFSRSRMCFCDLR